MTNDHWSRLFRLHAHRYPESRIQDALKLIHQAVCGAGHLVQDKAGSLARIQQEAALAPLPAHRYDPVGNGLARLFLGGLPDDLSLHTVERAFRAAARPGGASEDKDRLTAACAALESLCQSESFPFTPEEVRRAAAVWRADGFPALHHSEAYKAAYAPAYRLVWVQVARYLPLLSAIDRILAKQGQCTLAIDGDCGAGKTFFASQLQRIYGCTVLHIDDFFLPAARKTPERLQTPGGNVDWERFLAEVAPPLEHRASFSYRRFDCVHQVLQPIEPVSPTPLVIVEGSYSLHPKLRHLYDVSAFLTLSTETQLARLAPRGNARLSRFVSEWIPMEKAYHAAFSPAQESTFCFSAEDECQP